MTQSQLPLQVNQYTTQAQEESVGGDTYRHLMVNPAAGQTIIASPKRQEPYLASQKGLQQVPPELMHISEVGLNQSD